MQFGHSSKYDYEIKWNSNQFDWLLKCWEIPERIKIRPFWRLESFFTATTTSWPKWCNKVTPTGPTKRSSSALADWSSPPFRLTSILFLSTYPQLRLIWVNNWWFDDDWNRTLSCTSMFLHWLVNWCRITKATGPRSIRESITCSSRPPSGSATRWFRPDCIVATASATSKTHPMVNRRCASAPPGGTPLRSSSAIPSKSSF